MPPLNPDLCQCMHTQYLHIICYGVGDCLFLCRTTLLSPLMLHCLKEIHGILGAGMLSSVQHFASALQQTHGHTNSTRTQAPPRPLIGQNALYVTEKMKHKHDQGNVWLPWECFLADSQPSGVYTRRAG